MAAVCLTCNALKHDTIKVIATEQTPSDDENIAICGLPLTCDYYLDTPCNATCWHNDWQTRDAVCTKMGTFDCRWSFPAVWIMGGTCFCCDDKC